MDLGGPYGYGGKSMSPMPATRQGAPGRRRVAQGGSPPFNPMPPQKQPMEGAGGSSATTVAKNQNTPALDGGPLFDFQPKNSMDVRGSRYGGPQPAGVRTTDSGLDPNSFEYQLNNSPSAPPAAPGPVGLNTSPAPPVGPTDPGAPPPAPPPYATGRWAGATPGGIRTSDAGGVQPRQRTGGAGSAYDAFVAQYGPRPTAGSWDGGVWKPSGNQNAIYDWDARLAASVGQGHLDPNGNRVINAAGAGHGAPVSVVGPNGQVSRYTGGGIVAGRPGSAPILPPGSSQPPASDTAPPNDPTRPPTTRPTRTGRPRVITRR